MPETRATAEPAAAAAAPPMATPTVADTPRASVARALQALI